METFGQILAKLMKSRKISQASLGRSVGCHRTTIGDYVHDKYLPTEESFHRIHQVIPDKELYDAFFAEAKPKDRKNKPLISENLIYNYYTAETDNASKVRNIVEQSISQHSIVISNTDAENLLIARALIYVVAAFEQEDLQTLAPNDYAAYKALMNKYRDYLN